MAAESKTDIAWLVDDVTMSIVEIFDAVTPPAEPHPRNPHAVAAQLVSHAVMHRNSANIENCRFFFSFNMIAMDENRSIRQFFEFGNGQP